jgi:sugar lactone lactonase YvrE
VRLSLFDALSLSFGPDANNDGVPELYVAGQGSNTIVRYDGVTGKPLGTFVTAGSGGLTTPEGICFDPSQTYLYVASSGSNQVLKHNAQTGAYVGVAAASGLPSPEDVKFGPDDLLYVLSSGNNRIERFNTSGTYVDDYVPAGGGGMVSPCRMTFGPDGDLYVSDASNEILRFGTESEAIFTVSTSTVSPLAVSLNYATSDGTAIAGTNYTAASGTVTIASGVTSGTIHVPILDDGQVDPSLSFTVNLSNANGGVITRSQGVGTITDSDAAAKFYVVNDATPTIGGTSTAYKYQPSGTPQAPFGLSLNDLDPRGVATNAAGRMEWVVDANKNVYVYSPGGTLLGSWSAGGLSSSAQLTGIATNGTDIWLVDSSSDKVYRYAGAASRLSGSQNAASSFSLAGGHNGNGNPQDLVTDGTSFWVVDGTALKVFKYTLSGSALGSWSIDPANAHPTGITINPYNVSDVWIVDSGTDKVYQYVSTASHTSGSQNAAATFALAAGNSNPQGIADPPPADLSLTPATAPIAPGLPPPASLNAAAARGPSAGAGLPSLAGRDAAFALLARESLPVPGEPVVGLLAGGALTPRLDSPAPAVDRAWSPAGASGGQKPLDPLTLLPPGSIPGIRSEPSAVSLLDGTWGDDDSQASEEAAVFFFAGPADDAAAED